MCRIPSKLYYICYVISAQCSGYQPFTSTSLTFASTSRIFASTSRTFASTSRTFAPTSLTFTSTSRTSLPLLASLPLLLASIPLLLASMHLYLYFSGFASTSRVFASTSRQIAPTSRIFAFISRTFVATSRTFASISRIIASTFGIHASISHTFAFTSRIFASTSRTFAYTSRIVSFTFVHITPFPALELVNFIDCLTISRTIITTHKNTYSTSGCCVLIFIFLNMSGQKNLDSSDVGLVIYAKCNLFRCRDLVLKCSSVNYHFKSLSYNYSDAFFPITFTPDPHYRHVGWGSEMIPLRSLIANNYAPKFYMFTLLNYPCFPLHYFHGGGGGHRQLVS